MKSPFCNLSRSLISLFLLLLILPLPCLAQAEPDPSDLLQRSEGELRDLVSRFAEDLSALERRWDVPSETKRERMRRFYGEWDTLLGGLDYDSLGVEDRIDWQLLHGRITYDLAEIDREENLYADTAAFLPFAQQIVALHEARRNLATVDPKASAETLEAIRLEVEKTQKMLSGEKEEGVEGKEEAEITPMLAHRASKIVRDLRTTLGEWHALYDAYDPLFSWWTKDPFAKTDKALELYYDFLRSDIVGEKEGDDPPIIGESVGRDALVTDLRRSLIPYDPEELMEIAEREFAWCEEQRLAASRELGYGDDWKAALEHVKTLHVEPGRQPDLVRELSNEAVDFLEKRDLLTIPDLAKEIWRLRMLSPEWQKQAPFFLGGEVVQVAFPTDTMTHEDKLMSLRGNNVHFSRAVVHHELIPGHHLQFFMVDRYQTHRRLFITPFWTEGWALYWEMMLWDKDFPQSPEDRIGMLFWRMHRCARILFSLGFHLGDMTPQEAIDLLVDRVGHERANATAEVRRSFEGSYPPLYQLAYMTGAIQLRALREELVDTGKISEKVFHDEILRGGNMPIEMVRARLRGDALAKDFETSWRFAD